MIPKRHGNSSVPKLLSKQEEEVGKLGLHALPRRKAKKKCASMVFI